MNIVSIGRYILTLFIAAVCSGLVYLVIRDIPSLADVAASGDPKLLAGGISSAIMTFLLGIPGMVVLGYLVWRLVSLVFLRPTTNSQSSRKYLISGVLTHSGLFLAFSALLAFGPKGFDLSGLALSVFATLVAGLAWGWIFWKMDPRSSAHSANIGEEFG